MIENSKRATVCGVAVMVGLLAMLVLAVLPLVDVTIRPWMRVAYAVAAGLVLLGRLAEPRPAQQSLRARRLRMLLVVAALLMCASAALLFWRSAGPTDWVAFLLAGTLMQAYASTMLDRIEKNGDGSDEKAKKS